MPEPEFQFKRSSARVHRRRARVSVAILLALLLPLPPAWSDAAQRSVRAQNGMVVSEHHLASEAGVQILKRGGNAVDAAIATGFALAVVLPFGGNIGGGGFMVVRTAGGEVTSFDFREKAPAAAHPKMYLDENGEHTGRTNTDGPLSIGVPGTVAGFFLAHERFGRLPMKDLTEPAVRLAEKGFSLSRAQAERMAEKKEEFRKYPASARQFLGEDGEPFAPGDRLRQPDLARTLKRIGRIGRDDFYRGATARLIVQTMQKHGGLITAEDLAGYEAVERKPVRGAYRGYDIYSMPPPSAGGVALVEALNVLEGFDLREAGFGSARHIHLLAEVLRRASADRAQHLGDPDFAAEMPITKLISKKYADEIRGTIRMDRASESDPVRFGRIYESYESDDTTHVSAVDAEGNAVSMTFTLESLYGSKITVGGAGFLLNNEMGDFSAVPARDTSDGAGQPHPNRVEPGKRMVSSMAPAIVVRDGRPVLVLGSPGGRKILSAVLQTLVNVVDFRMNAADAVAAPRVHHQWLPDELWAEKFGVSPDTVKLLERFGHRIKVYGTPHEFEMGRVMAIQWDTEDEAWAGAVDPRAADGGAAGY